MYNYPYTVYQHVSKKSTVRLFYKTLAKQIKILYDNYVSMHSYLTQKVCVNMPPEGTV